MRITPTTRFTSTTPISSLASDCGWPNDRSFYPAARRNGGSPWPRAGRNSIFRLRESARSWSGASRSSASACSRWRCLQSWVGLGPLRRVRAAIQDLRATGASRIDEPLPLEVQPLVEEVNALLAHTDQQAEEARTHAGNLAHALKTPLTVVTNAATAPRARSFRHRDP